MSPRLILLPLLLTALLTGLLCAEPAGCRAAAEIPPALATGQSADPSPPSLELQETTSLLLALLKGVGALGLVLGLLWLLVQLLKKTGLAQSSLQAGSLIQVVESRMIGPKKYVTILEVAGELLAVGVTDQQINLLARLDSSNSQLRQATSAAGSGPPKIASFAQLLKKAGRKTSAPPPRDEE